jgi:hypothetical protein
VTPEPVTTVTAAALLAEAAEDALDDAAHAFLARSRDTSDPADWSAWADLRAARRHVGAAILAAQRSAARGKS